MDGDTNAASKYFKREFKQYFRTGWLLFYVDIVV